MPSETFDHICDEFSQILLEMFPSESQHFLRQCLVESNYDVQDAIERILTARESGADATDIPGSKSKEIDSPMPPVRLLILVGLPGSGKSTLSKAFAECGWVIVCQDVLGNRRACELAVDTALRAGERVVVDRTNIDCAQRAHFLHIAQSHGVGPAGAACLHLDLHPAECVRRVLTRTGHPTLPAREESKAVVWQFRRRQQRPVCAEGFGRVIRVTSDSDTLFEARELLGPRAAGPTASSAATAACAGAGADKDIESPGFILPD
jgi:predicted kinase